MGHLSAPWVIDVRGGALFLLLLLIWLLDFGLRVSAYGRFELQGLVFDISLPDWTDSQGTLGHELPPGDQDGVEVSCGR